MRRKTVPHRPHQRIGFGPEPEFAGGVEREEPDEPEQGSHEEARESFLGCHEIRGSKGLQSEESGGADHRNTSGGKIGIFSQSSKRFGESSDRTQKKPRRKAGQRSKEFRSEIGVDLRPLRYGGNDIERNELVAHLAEVLVAGVEARHLVGRTRRNLVVAAVASSVVFIAIMMHLYFSLLTNVPAGQRNASPPIAERIISTDR